MTYKFRWTERNPTLFKSLNRFRFSQRLRINQKRWVRYILNISKHLQIPTSVRHLPRLSPTPLNPTYKSFLPLDKWELEGIGQCTL